MFGFDTDMLRDPRWEIIRSHIQEAKKKEGSRKGAEIAKEGKRCQRH